MNIFVTWAFKVIHSYNTLIKWQNTGLFKENGANVRLIHLQLLQLQKYENRIELVLILKSFHLHEKTHLFA